MFECKRCGYTSRVSQNLRTHLRRKKICIAKDDESDIDPKILLDEIEDTLRTRSTGISNKGTVVCEKCNKIYTCKSSLKRHQQKCCPQKRKTDDDLIAVLIEQIKKNGIGNVINNNIQNNNIQNNLNINFNNCVAFQNADTKTIEAFFKHLSDGKFADYIQMKDVNDIHPRLLKDVMFNEDRKENMTLAVLDVENNKAKLFDGQVWQSADAKEVIKDILLINAYMIKEKNAKMPAAIYRDPNEFNPLFAADNYAGNMVRLAHDNLHLVERVHGKIG